MAKNTVNLDPEEQWYRELRHSWMPVAYSSDLTDKPVSAILFGERLVAARLADDFVVFDDLCRHRGTALSLGWVEDGLLRCPYHGWTYDANGTVVDVPARPELSGRLKVKIPSYPVVEAAGLVWTCLEEPKFRTPEFDERYDPSYRAMQMKPFDWACSLPRGVETYLELSRSKFGHEGSQGTAGSSPLDWEVARRGHEIRLQAARADAPATPAEQAPDARSESNHGVDRNSRLIRIFMPNALLLKSGAGPKDEADFLFTALGAVSREVTRCFTVIGSNSSEQNEPSFRWLHELALGRAEDFPGSRPTQEASEENAQPGTLEYRSSLLEIIEGKF